MSNDDSIKFIFDQFRGLGCDKTAYAKGYVPYVPMLAFNTWDERLLFWQQSQYLSKYYPDYFERIFLKYQYPEHELLIFPDTLFSTSSNFFNDVDEWVKPPFRDMADQYSQFTPQHKKLYGSNDIKYDSITYINTFERMFDYHYEYNRGMGYDTELISKIQLIGNYEDKIKELMNGYVGVTITRAKYVNTHGAAFVENWSDKQITEYADSTRMYYDLPDDTPKLDYVYDEAYFDEIDSDSKVFVVSDVPNSLWYKSWKKQFKEVITPDKIHAKVHRMIKTEHPNVDDHLIDNIVPWLCLAFCDRIVGPRSKEHTYGMVDLVDYVGTEACMTAYTAARFRNRNLTYVTNKQ